eukprot:7352976-Pyramimonas_sp.AAC.2
MITTLLEGGPACARTKLPPRTEPTATQESPSEESGLRELENGESTTSVPPPASGFITFTVESVTGSHFSTPAEPTN